jgi:hypothetical protein
MLCLSSARPGTPGPDAHDAITSNSDLDTKKNLSFLSDVIARFPHEKGYNLNLYRHRPGDD